MSHISTFSENQKFREYTITHILSVYRADTPFRIGMSGGSVLWVLDSLREKLPDARNIEIYQIDERFVTEDHPDSNARAIREKIIGTGFRLIPFPIVSDSPESARKYSEILENITLDVAILGCGPDGHTASIFPQDPEIDTDALAYSTTTEVFAVRERMTTSFAIIERSTHIFLLMEGEKKREIFGKITDATTDYHEYPARRVMDMKQAEILYFR